MIALDATVLIALLRSADAHHAEAVDVLSSDDDFPVHAVNLAEALVAPARDRRENDALREWGAVGVGAWSTGSDEAVDLARLRIATGLKLPDCCVLLVAERTTRRLATFDARLARAARARGIEVLGVDD